MTRFTREGLIGYVRGQIACQIDNGLDKHLGTCIVRQDAAHLHPRRSVFTSLKRLSHKSDKTSRHASSATCNPIKHVSLSICRVLSRQENSQASNSEPRHDRSRYAPAEMCAPPYVHGTVTYGRTNGRTRITGEVSTTIKIRHVIYHAPSS